ncbi:MAG: RluA family pseudouridine synthase [Desulfovibrio sp.]
MRQTVEKECILLDFLMEASGAKSKKSMRNSIRDGIVFIDGQSAEKANIVLKPGQVIEINRSKPSTKVKSSVPIIYEDEHVLVVDKPAGMLSYDSGKHVRENLHAEVDKYVKKKYRDKKHAVLVHRLDRPVSGLLIFTTNRKLREQLHASWRNFDKVYTAVVVGSPEHKEAELVHYLTENADYSMKIVDPASREFKRVKPKKAVTKYKVIESFAKFTMIEVSIPTGRKHQIRVQLASIGHPVAGDKQYGEGASPAGRMCLHATRVKFKHPVTGKWVDVESKIPAEFRKFEKK